MSLRPLRLLALVVPLLACTAAAGQGTGRWQQRVRYDMDIRLLADRHQMEGRQHLAYENHSPDTLRRVFYHLYFNAFDPASRMAERNRNLPDPDGRVVPRIFELGPDEVGYHRVLSLTQNGRAVAYDVHDTILSVDLAEPIPPGGTAVFEMTFASQVPLQTRRNGRDSREGIDFSMAQWYPKMAAYDARGWHTDPYIGREFYAPFGTFDVRITLPAHYVVGGTGVLQNPDEIGHGYQTDTTRTYTYDPADSLTWHFVAENVHDFAWAADPDYVHDRFEDPLLGVTYHTLYQPDVAPAWAPMRRYVPAIIQFYSAHIGDYPYPQFSVIQAGDGGMEYPMVNFITGGNSRSPYARLGVTAHEAAHEWFYSVLANNEADHAWMDEGLTDYWTGEAVAHVLGQPAPSHAGSLINLVTLHEYGLFERLNTASDWFVTNAAYSTAAYSGGAMIAEVLGYVVSDSLRDAFFQEYFRRYRFRHPGPHDVEKVAEDVSGLVLDWFFEGFLNTTGRLDYAVEGLRSERTAGGWHTTVTLAQKGDLVLPVDLRLTLADGTTQWVNVPVSLMEGHKPVPAGWIVAAPWPWPAPRYAVEVDLPQRVVHVELEPLGKTPEVNRLNNADRLRFVFDFLDAPPQSWYRYGVGYRPLALAAHDFGPGLGVQARGQYIFGDHTTRAMLTLWPQVLFSGGEDPGPHYENDAKAFDGIDYELAYEHDVDALGPFATAAVRARKHLGVLENTVSVSKPFGRFLPLENTERRLTVSFLHQLIPTDRAFRIDGFPFFLNEHMASGRVAYRVARGGNRVEAGFEVGGSFRRDPGCHDRGFLLVGCDPYQSATHVFAEAVKTGGLGPFEGRAHVRLGLGADNLAPHKRFRLGAATAEEAWRHDAFRQVSSTMQNALDDAHLAALDGPGPVAYLLADRRGAPGRTPIGTRLLAGSLSVSTGPLAQRGWLRPVSVEAFSGIGTVWGPGSTFTDPLSGDEGFDATDLVADAGLGVQLDVARLPGLQRWTAQSDVLSGLRLALKLPLWASDPARIDAGEDAFAFRWLLGITIDG